MEELAGRGRRARRRGWRALAPGVLALAVALGPVAAGSAAAPPATEEGAQGQGSGQTRSTGPRRTQIGGVRSQGAREVERLGGERVPFPRAKWNGRAPKFHLGGVRGQGAPGMTGLPRTNAPELRPRTPAGATGVPAAAGTALTPGQVRAALLSGGGVRSWALERALQRSGVGGGVEAGPRIRTRPEDPRSSPDGLLRSLRERMGLSGLSPAAVHALVNVLAPTNGATALELARRELGAQGYVEVQLAPGDVAFVRSSDPAAVERIREMAPRIRAAANAEEQAHEWALRRHGFDPCGERRVTAVVWAEGEHGTTIDPRVLYGPTGAPPTDERPEPGFDAAVAALEAGRYADAARDLQAYLSREPEDTEVVRLLGVVQMLDGQTAAGIELIGRAYEADPFLAARPMGAAPLERRPGDLRRIVTAAVGHAHRTGSARAWLAAAVLMDAEGRPEQAVKMLERAVERGLDRSVAHEMMLALRP